MFSLPGSGIREISVGNWELGALGYMNGVFYLLVTCFNDGLSFFLLDFLFFLLDFPLLINSTWICALNLFFWISF